MKRPELHRPAEDLRARLLAAAARAPATPPGTWPRRLVLYGTLAAAWLVGLGAMLGVRHDWSQLPPDAVTQTLSGLAAAALLASAVGVSRGRAMVGATSGWLLGLVICVPAFLAILVATIAPQGPQSVPTVALARTIRCDLLVVIGALPLIGCAWALARGLTLARPALSGACVGLAAATWAHLVVRVHCAVSGADHALIGHLLPALPLMTLAAWAFLLPARPGGGAPRP